MAFPLETLSLYLCHVRAVRVKGSTHLARATGDSTSLYSCKGEHSLCSGQEDQEVGCVCLVSGIPPYYMNVYIGFVLMFANIVSTYLCFESGNK